MSNYTADITSELNSIKNAKYGEEVRDSIISAIRKINTVTEEFTTAINAIVSEIQEAAAEESITPIDTSVLSDYATKDYVDSLVNGSDAIYRLDLVQAAMSSVTQGKTVNSSGEIIDTDDDYYMSDILITPSQSLKIISENSSFTLGYAIYRDDTNAFISLTSPVREGAGQEIVLTPPVFNDRHYAYRILIHSNLQTAPSVNYVKAGIHTTYSRLDMLEEAIESITPGGSPDLSGYLTKAEFNQEMVNYADVNDVDPFTVLANSLVWKKKAGTSGAVVDGDYHYYASSKIICPSRDITITCDISDACLGYISYSSDGTYKSQLLPDGGSASNSVTMHAITTGDTSRCYRLLLYLPSYSDMDRTLWLRSQFNTLYGRVDDMVDSVSDLEEDVSSLQPAYLQMSLGASPELIHNGTDLVVPFNTIDAVAGTAVSKTDSYAMISESGNYEVTAVCGITGVYSNTESAILKVKHSAQGSSSWQNDVIFRATPYGDPFFMKAGPVIVNYDAGDTIEAVITMSTSDSQDIMGYASNSTSYTYLLIRKL